MGRYQNVIINDHQRTSFLWAQLFPNILCNLGLFEQIYRCRFTFERAFFGDDESILCIIMCKMILICFLDCFVKSLRVFLKEEDICFKLAKVLLYLCAFSVFIQEALIEERFKSFDIFLDIKSLCLTKITDFVDISEKAMEHSQIVLFCNFFFLLFKGHLQFGYLDCKHLFPFFFKSFLRQKFPVFNSCLQIEHRRVSRAKFLIDFAHLPLEFSLIEVREVAWDKIYKLFADVFQLGKVIIAVEFERAVHDAAIIQSGHSERCRGNYLRRGRKRSGLPVIYTSHFRCFNKQIY